MDTRNTNLTAAELRAIQDHKHFLSQQRGREVSLEEAIENFLSHFAEVWRQEKLHRDNLDQREEIDRHKWLRSEKEGRDIGGAVAAGEWCEQFAHIWRAERESLERNGFQRLSIVVRTQHGLHMRPWSRIAQLAARYDCDFYVHKDGMPFWNFLLENRPFVNIRSVVSILSMGITMGDTVEFVATGPQATEALTALAQLLSGADTEE